MREGLSNLENIAPKPTWEKPKLEQEIEELERTAHELHIDPSSLLEAFQNAQLEKLSDEDWRMLENTKSADETWTLDQVREELKNTRDFSRIEHGLTHGDILPSPILLFRKDTSPYLIAGDSRLLGCRVLGVRPTVLALRLES